MGDVTIKHSEYQANIDKWRIVQEAATGDDVKKRIPELNKLDGSEENRQRNIDYKERAVFYNALGRTLTGMVGLVFAEDPKTKVGALLEYIESDIDGQGVGIDQQATKALNDVISVGRCGLFVDYPEVTEGLSKQQADLMKIRPSCTLVTADNITYWETTKISGITALTLVIIKQKVKVKVNEGFGTEDKIHYLVLELVDNKYQSSVYKNDAGLWEAEDIIYPTDNSGSSLLEIPFFFIGAVDNRPNVGVVPSLDIAELSIAHLLNSADYEDSVHFTGQAQPYITGLDTDWRDHLEKKGMHIGSRSPLLLPEGSFGFAQVQPNIMAMEAMNHKEGQMMARGANLLAPDGSAVKTAEQSSSETKQRHSTLSLAVANINRAFVEALRVMAMFAGDSSEPEYELSNAFMSKSLTAQDALLLAQVWQTGMLPSSDLWEKYRDGGLIDSNKTDKEIEAETESDDTGLGLDGDNEVTDA